MKKYFAYGSCTNYESFRETMKEEGCGDKFRVLGIGKLKDYRLAFTRRSIKWGGGSLDIIESPGDYVLGVVYEIPEEGITALNRREGAQPFANYHRKIDLKVELNNEETDVFAYTVVDKDLKEIAPPQAYFDAVYEGLAGQVPPEYINKYLVEHCKKRFGIDYLKNRAG